MRTSVAVAIILASASAAPSLAAPISTDAILARNYNDDLEARNAKKVLGKIGHVAGGIAKGLLHFLREDNTALYAREPNEQLVARVTNELEARNAKKVLGKIGHVAGGLAKGLLHFLKREDAVLAHAIEDNPILARALEDHIELYARAIEEDEELFARNVGGELEARSAKKVLGKIGHVAGGLAKGLLHFLREDTPELYTRLFEEKDTMVFVRDVEIDKLD